VPRLTVLVPAVPRSPWLAETLHSIQSQTYQDWQVFLVLDGESAQNRAAAEILPAGKVRVLTTPSQPSYPAGSRNVGLEQCDTELVAFCDADDVCEPTRFERQVAEFDRNPELGALGTWARRFESATGADLGPQHCPADPDVLARTLLWFNPMTTSSMMLRTRLFTELGRFDTAAIRTEDYDMWLRILGNAQVAALPEELVRYRVHGGHHSSGRMIGEQSAVIRRSKVAAARRLGRSVPRIWAQHAVWVCWQLAHGRW